MPTLPVFDMSNAKVGDIELAAEIFDVEINEGLVHQAVVMQLASRRLGTHATKTRGMVRGGGTIFGPHPRDYSFTMPRKQRRLALKCVLTDKVKSEDLIILDDLNFDEPKTKKFVEFQKTFGVDDCKSLFITKELIDNVTRSANNLQNAKTISAIQLNVFDILNSKKLFITKDAVEKIQEVYA